MVNDILQVGHINMETVYFVLYFRLCNRTVAHYGTEARIRTEVRYYHYSYSCGWFNWRRCHGTRYVCVLHFVNTYSKCDVSLDLVQSKIK